jgi:hypothetical protein
MIATDGTPTIAHRPPTVSEAAHAEDFVHMPIVRGDEDAEGYPVWVVECECGWADWSLEKGTAYRMAETHEEQENA